MHIDILSLFPEYFRGPLDESIVKRVQEKGLVTIELVDIRDYSQGRHRKVDDRPYGGGPGMVMMAEPICHAIRDKRREGSRVIYLSPQGPTLKAEKCRQLAAEKHLILLCGHYEGIDERVFKEIDEEVSIGDFVLTNGCLAACVLIDTVIRFLPGAVGDEQSVAEDSFEQGRGRKGLLHWPQFTRPDEFEGERVPEVLLSGNHKEIQCWREEQALQKTKKVRPDLIKG